MPRLRTVGSANSMQALLWLCHYLFPVLLGLSLAWYAKHRLAALWSEPGIVTLLAGIALAYSYDRLVDTSVAARNSILAHALIFTGVMSSLIMLYAVVHLTEGQIIVIGFCGAVSLTYPLLKRIAGVKNSAVALVWSVALLFLPLVPGSVPPAAMLELGLVYFIYILMGCMLCDVKDQKLDHLSGVKSAVSTMGFCHSQKLIMGLGAILGLLSLCLRFPAITLGGCGLLILATQFELLETPILGPLLVDAVMTMPGIIFWIFMQ